MIPSSDAWRSTWLEPSGGVVREFAGRPGPDGGIELTGRRDDMVVTRWSFSEITPTSFRWRNEESVDGRTWRLYQTFEATRA